MPEPFSNTFAERLVLDRTVGGVRLLVCRLDGGPREERRNREREAVGCLLAYALDASAVMAHRSDGAPYVEGRPELCVSVSHSPAYAALALAPFAIGIDIEEPRAQLKRVAPRVFSEAEIEAFDGEADLLRAWTVKEALYKLCPSPEACDFRGAMTAEPPQVCGRRARIVAECDLESPAAHLTLLALE